MVIYSSVFNKSHLLFLIILLAVKPSRSVWQCEQCMNTEICPEEFFQYAKHKCVFPKTAYADSIIEMSRYYYNLINANNIPKKNVNRLSFVYDDPTETINILYSEFVFFVVICGLGRAIYNIFSYKKYFSSKRARYPIRLYKNCQVKYEGDCGICLTKFTSFERVVVLHCNHIFHYDCLILKDEKMNQHTCPNCRKDY